MIFFFQIPIWLFYNIIVIQVWNGFPGPFKNKVRLSVFVNGETPDVFTHLAAILSWLLEISLGIISSPFMFHRKKRKRKMSSNQHECEWMNFHFDQNMTPDFWPQQFIVQQQIKIAGLNACVNNCVCVLWLVVRGAPLCWLRFRWSKWWAKKTPAPLLPLSPLSRFVLWSAAI